MEKRTKTCSKCNQEKDLTGFYRKARNKDGRDIVCKECHKVYQKNDYDAKKKNRLPVQHKPKTLTGKILCNRNGKSTRRDDCFRGCNDACFACQHIHDANLKTSFEAISPEEYRKARYDDRVCNEVFPNHYLVI